MGATKISIHGWTLIDAAWKNAEEIVRQELSAAMVESTLKLLRDVSELEEYTPSAFGTLRKSMFASQEVLSDRVLGVTGTSLNYAPAVELGTKPHPVSAAGIHALTDWVRLRLGYTEEEAEKMAHGIAWKIRHHGTKPVGMFSRAFAANEGKIASIFGAARDRIATRLTGQ